MAKGLFITSQRMLKLMEYAIREGLVANQQEFGEKIGINNPGMANVKKGKQQFTHLQIQKACQMTGFSADWIFGFTDIVMRDTRSKTPIKLLKEAVLALESQLDKRKSRSK